MSEIKGIEKCRSCGSESLYPIISLGNQYIVNFVDSKTEGPRCPLDLILCDDCRLVQLKHNAPPESMWGEQYWYKSGINRMIREDLGDIVNNVKRLVNPKEGDIVVDIGCNDGTLMGFYKQDGLNLVGFEPSGNVAREADSKGFNVINDFFNKESYQNNLGNKKAKAITAISMFYDLENPNQFLQDVNSILDPRGLFVIQQNYLATMLENNAFDNICHEHREYYSLSSLEHLLGRHNMKIFDIEQNGINGGSIRTYITSEDNNSFDSKEAEERVKKIRELESQMGLDTIKPYSDFANRIKVIKEELVSFLKKEKEGGKKICGLGASTRGLVLSQYFGLNTNLMECIFDRNPDKEGKLAVGSWIPITSPDNFHKYNPDYQLVFIWHIFKGIGEDEKKFVEKGGKFILPLSQFRIIDNFS